LDTFITDTFINAIIITSAAMIGFLPMIKDVINRDKKQFTWTGYGVVFFFLVGLFFSLMKELRNDEKERDNKAQIDTLLQNQEVESKLSIQRQMLFQKRFDSIDTQLSKYNLKIKGDSIIDLKMENAAPTMHLGNGLRNVQITNNKIIYNLGGDKGKKKN
jgi:hypothetical protein